MLERMLVWALNPGADVLRAQEEFFERHPAVAASALLAVFVALPAVAGALS